MRKECSRGVLFHQFTNYVFKNFMLMYEPRSLSWMFCLNFYFLMSKLNITLNSIANPNALGPKPIKLRINFMQIPMVKTKSCPYI